MINKENMAAPKIPIEVGEESGVWQTDGLPMLYVPRHFFNNLHLSIEQMVGHQSYRKNLFHSGHHSAYFWCDKTAKEHNLQPIECFEFYLKRLSERGWAQYCFKNEDLANGYAEIEVKNSSFVLHKKTFDLQDNFNACYMFEGWFAGAADWVSDQLKWHYEYECQEKICQSVDDVGHCLFVVSAKQSKDE